MKSQMEDYYKILGVSKTATQAEIKKAYRKLAQKHHPDLAEDKEKAKAEFQKLQQAYDALKDPEKRRMYDQLGPDFERMGGAGGGGNPFAGFGGQGGQGPEIDMSQFFGGGGGQNPGGAGGFSFEDIFRQFGGQGGGSGRSSRGGRRAPRSKGADANASVTVPFNVAVQGGETSVGLKRGEKSQTIKVKIPAGIESGKKIRLRGQGDPSPDGGTAGDLLLQVNVSDHPHFRRSGDNLLLTLPISFFEAVRGAKVDVPTPKGTVTVTVPPNSSSGKKLRLRGMGVQNSDHPGDLVIELSIRLPEKTSDDDATLIDKLSGEWKIIESRESLAW